jgi:putative ABC transport system permease protein
MLSYTTFPIRNLLYHWRSSLPIVLGVAIGAAVLAGALIIGDSLRGSLKDRALKQLGDFKSAYVGQQLIREEASRRLSDSDTVHPFLILQGTLSSESAQLPRVTVYGLPESAFAKFQIPDFKNEFGILLSTRVAAALKANSDTTLSLGVEKMSGLPRSSFLGRRNSDDVAKTQTMKVVSILAATDSLNDLSLTPSPQAPMNVFVRLADLQKLIDKPGRINALLTESEDVTTLNYSLGRQLRLADWGLRLTVPTRRPVYLSVESEQLVLNGTTISAIEQAAKSLNAPSERTLSYLANAITRGNTPLYSKQAADINQVIPYSVVGALNAESAAPLGPFLPAGVNQLADDEIIFAEWPESPFKDLKPGEPITLTYFKPEMEASLDETFATFKFKGLIPLTGVADDPNLTPPFPGITDSLKISEWKSPFEMNRTRLRPNDRNEQYWNKYRSTPKVYITRTKGEQLFGSRFGTATSVRVAPPAGMKLDDFSKLLETELLKNLNVPGSGVQFINLKERALQASQGGTDFGALFLAFSWLLIFTGLLLVGLLFRLALDRRAKEVGLLLATGYSHNQVQRLLMREGIVLALIGSILGILLALGYAKLMMSVLVGLWPDREVGNYLQLHVQPGTPFIAEVLILVISWLTIRISLRGLVRVPPPALLRGVTKPQEGLSATSRRPILSLGFAVLLLMMGLGALAGGRSAKSPDERSMAFFSGGGMLMISGLLLARAWLKRTPRGVSSPSVIGLGLRNAGRNPLRTLLTATLIAVASFLVISVESFRRAPDQDFLSKSGGSGGFSLLGEADVPLFNSLDRESGFADLQTNLQRIYQNEGGNAEERSEQDVQKLKGIEAFGLHMQGGDDASCLNLFQANKPRILGLPSGLLQRGGFRFTQTEASTAEERANPWLLLQKELKPGEPIPVIAEQNSAMFMLKTMLGGVFEIQDENGTPVKVRLVAMIQDSVFQSELLMADTSFRKLFPHQEGYRLFLINPQSVESKTVSSTLQKGFRNHGFSVTKAADKVAQYQAVVGAYLTTFQLLGGFALLLAILGLGVVILRGVWERTGEMALLRAVGYRSSALQELVLAETVLVLAVGLGIGIGAALLSVLPSLSLGGGLPLPQLLGLIAAVGITAILVTLLATRSVAKVPIISGLRQE